MVDMAHFAGLVAAGLQARCRMPISSPPTHKTLRGPRAGMVLSNDEEIGKKINSAVFPSLQGGPLMHIIAAKAVAFGEALKPDYKLYIKGVIDNAKALGESLVKGGAALVSGGTDTHLMLVDLRPKKLTGKAARSRSVAPTSPATRTACRSIRRSPRSLPASASARRQEPLAASASPSSSRSAG